jgi:2-haloalkanoic acid dehalogenase type II
MIDPSISSDVGPVGSAARRKRKSPYKITHHRDYRERILMIKAVLFDGYGTLFNCSLEALIDISSAVVRAYNLPMSGEEFLTIWDRYFFPLLQTEPFLLLREANRRSLDMALAELGIARDTYGYGHRFSDLLNVAPVYPEVHEVLSRLDGVIRHGILSNADDENITGALRTNDLRVEFVVTSESVRSYKPAPHIFLHALNRLGCRPEEVLYVGDSPEDDVVGARGVGMQMAWVNRRRVPYQTGLPEPDYIVEDLRGVLEILRS